MIHTTRPLSRRPRVERQVLAVLRGEHAAHTVPDKATCFLRLRILAGRNDLALLSPGTPYIGESELTLLAWIAAAQRTVAPGFRPPHPCLAGVIDRCAGTLAEMGLRLYPFTLYSHRLRAPA